MLGNKSKEEAAKFLQQPSDVTATPTASAGDEFNGKMREVAAVASSALKGSRMREPLTRRPPMRGWEAWRVELAGGDELLPLKRGEKSGGKEDTSASDSTSSASPSLFSSSRASWTSSTSFSSSSSTHEQSPGSPSPPIVSAGEHNLALVLDFLMPK